MIRKGENAMAKCKHAWITVMVDPYNKKTVCAHCGEEKPAKEPKKAEKPEE